MHDSSTCEVCRGLPIRDSLSDDEFFAFLASCRNELAAKQLAFERRIDRASRWSYDMAERTLANAYVQVCSSGLRPNPWLCFCMEIANVMAIGVTQY